MDDHSSKRSWESLFVNRKGSTLVRRDTSNDRDRNHQYCSQIGCRGNPNSPVGVQVGSSEMTKSSHIPLQSTSNGKGTMGSSSRTYSAMNNTGNSRPEASEKLCLQLTETGAVLQDEPDVPEPSSLQDKVHRSLQPETDGTQSSGIAAVHVGSFNAPINTRMHRNFNQKSAIGNHDAVSSTIWIGRNASRYDLGNLGCDFVSDVVPSSLSSNSDLAGRKDVAKRRNCEGETSSSSQGKRTSNSWFERGNTSLSTVTTINNRCNPVSDVGPSNSSLVSDLTGGKDVKRRVYDGEANSSAQGKRMGKSWFQRGNTSSSSGIDDSESRPARDGLQERSNVGSVRTRRSLSGYTRTRITGLGSGNSLSPNDSRGLAPQISQPDVSINMDTPGTAHQLSVETSLSRSSLYGPPGTGNEGSQIARPSSPVEVGNRRTSFLNRESFSRYNMGRIAEVLLALERIEPDEDLAYEQLLVLETNLFRSGLNINDQHRDMRLDIDNMSYEELLALEDRMGTVSTALSEVAFTECVEASIYHSTTAEEATTEVNGDKDDVKCSICQDEYKDGEEVGRLQCEHRYHTICVQQWLRLKNWCPICKASAVPSSPPPAT